VRLGGTDWLGGIEELLGFLPEAGRARAARSWASLAASWASLAASKGLEAYDLVGLGSEERFQRPEACDLVGLGSEEGLQVGDPSQQGLQGRSRGSGRFHAGIRSQKRADRHMPQADHASDAEVGSYGLFA
jgi:hypothetical protein